jgi:hypothetical protein
MHYALPPNLTLERFEYWRYMRVRHDPGDAYTNPVTYVSLKSPVFDQEFEWCGEGCDGWGTETTAVVPENHAISPQYEGLRNFYFGVDCVGYNPCNTRPGNTAAMQVAAFDAQLRDDLSPTTTNVTGSLTETGPHGGVEQVKFTAKDIGSGVYRAKIALKPRNSAEYDPRADIIVDGNDGRCAELDFRTDTDREFGFRQPCRLTAAASAALDTTKVPDGDYDLRVTVEDAAGNVSTVYESSDFKVDNVPAGGSTGSPGTPPGGSSGSSSSPGAGSGGTAGGDKPSRGDANGTNASDGARLTLTGPRVVPVGFGRGARTTLTLRDENGRPIGGASVVVLQRMAVPGGAWVPAHSPVITDGDGRVRYSIEPGYSRTLRFGYKAHVGDADYAVTHDKTVRVRSRTTFRTSRSFLHNGQAVRFIGRLLSRPVPRNGVVIDLQAQVGHRWQTFETVRTRADGRWHASYRFRRTTGLQTYIFRARVRGDTGFPYAPSISRHTSVRVRG